MKKRERFTLVVLGMLALCLFVFPSIASANGSTWHVAATGSDESGNGSSENPWQTIQGAINKPEVINDDVIIVHDGTYNENVYVNRSLTIKSESGYAKTTVVAASANDHVFDVRASNVTIGGENCGFSIYGATGYYMAGIYLGSGITGCTIQDNRCGWDDTHNNNYGIYLDESGNNTLTGNTASSNTDRGIYLYSSSNNTLTDNTANNNEYEGIYLYESGNNTLTGNTASSNASYGIYLYSSSINTLTNNNASNNYCGIILDGSGKNTLTGNTASSNDIYGIFLYYSSNNTFTGNTARSNTNYGIYLYYSSNDTLTDNTMSGNQYNFSVEGELLSEYTHNIDASNMVESKPIYYWVNQQNKQIPSDAGYVGIVNSNNIIVKDLTLENNGEGVLFAYTTGSRIENVNASNNSYGIYLNDSCNANTLTGNTASSNVNYGIFLYDSGNNTLTNNNASNNDYGIYLYSSSNDTLTNNNASNNSFGIYLYSSSNDTLTNNNASNNSFGIYLYESGNNTLTDNTADNNYYDGIYLNHSSNNTLTDNTANNNEYEGIYLYESGNNTLTGNTANNNENEGIYLDWSCNANTITGNTASSNFYGILLSSSSSNTIYLNNLSDNTCGNASVMGECSGNIWNSPTPIYYDYTSGSFHKNYLGNYYSDYDTTGKDLDRDGIGDSVYTTIDGYPLTTTSDHYSLQAWWINSDSKMYKDDRSKSINSISLNSGSSNIWTADQATLMDIEFSGGDTWTGQIVFTSAPESDHTFTIEIGSSTDGSDFTAGGPDATINGNGSATVFTYTTDASGFTVTTGNYLALRITNNSSSSYDVQTGGAWSYCSSPLNSTDYSLPVELTSFTATPGNGIITLNWLTESEIENLGFNIYRSTNTNLEFIILNAELIPGAGSSSEKHEYSYVDHDVKSGITYWYKLEDVDYKGKTELHGAISAAVLGPKEFCLHPNYPNPFNPVTTISYDLPQDVYVELTVYNMLGEKVTTLVKGNQPAGYYNVEWDGRNSQGRIVSSGMYFLRISAGSYCKTNKMVIVR